MRILFLAGRELSYPRNEVLLRALQRFAEVEVVGIARQPRSLLLSSAQVALQAWRKLWQNDYDLLFVGFYGHLLLQMIQRFSRTPILFDAFFSSYDTLVGDRQNFSADSWRGRLAWWLDQNSCQRATHVLVDTPAQADYFVQTFGLDPRHFTALPIGCSDAIFQPQPPPPGQPGVTNVFYFCTFLPLHGVATVLEAAAQLQNEPIRLRILGDGPLLPTMKKMARQLNLENVIFGPFVPTPKLAPEIAQADICLGGHFGPSNKAQRAVPGKIYQILAMARPVIAADTLANRALLQHGVNAYFVPAADPNALATAIRTLHHDQALRAEIARQGRQLYVAECSELVITERLRQLVQRL